MAQEQRGGGQEIIDVLITVDIPNSRSLALRNIDRIRLVVARSLAHAARNDALGLCEQRKGGRRALSVLPFDVGHDFSHCDFPIFAGNAASWPELPVIDIHSATRWA